MPPKRFEGRFGIPSSHPVDSLLTQSLYRLPESVSPERIERLATDITDRVNSARERDGNGTPLKPGEIQTLHLKLARHYEDNGESANINIPTCVDALVESPRFLNSDKGSMEKLFKLHEMRTLQKRAEIRKRRAEMGDTEAFNPYENLLTTTSGNYYIARLLNMPHLEEESEYMKHCVGTSDSYINKIKRGEVEILSFRSTPRVDPKTQKFTGDTSIITIEYNLKTKTIEQMRKFDDAYLTKDEPYFTDMVDALKQLRTTRTDTGELRNFSKISPNELENISVRDEYILTEHGEIHFHDFDPESSGFVLKMGRMRIIPETPKADAAQMIKIVDGAEYSPDQIAYNLSEIGENTKAYIGKLEPGIFDVLPRTIENVYTKFPEERIKFRNIELGTGIKDGPEFQKAIEGQRMEVYKPYASDILESPDFKVAGERGNYDLVEVSVRSLGFDKNTRYDVICARALELGLELCPAEVGPQLRLQYKDQPLGEYLIVAMNAINDSGGSPRVFNVHRSADGLWLDSNDGRPVRGWDPEHRFVFLRPRKY